VPSFTLSGSEKLRYLLVPDSNVAKAIILFLPKAVQLPIIVGSDALTADHHFEQAGFRAVFK
jgi:hypothetical protein